MRRNQNSGQILLVAAFIMASLLLSAQLYILEVGKTSGETNSDSLNDFVLSVKLGSRHVVVGSLANISTGGTNGILEFNLQEWAEFIGRQYLGGKNVLNFTLEETAPYSSGICLSWNGNGYGVSSASVNCAHTLAGRETDVETAYSINVTTALFISSTNRMSSETLRQINVTINVLNGALPARAEQITVYYEVSGTWLIPDDTNDYALLDYGNGTYIASFTATVPTPEVEVSVHIIDFRGIYVQANATSTEI